MEMEQEEDPFKGIKEEREVEKVRKGECRKTCIKGMWGYGKGKVKGRGKV